MIYEKSINFRGDSRRAMEAATEFAMSNGYKISSRTDSMLTFTGPATNKRHRGDNPLAWISRAQITVTGSTLSIRAETGSGEPPRVLVFVGLLAVGLLLFVVVAAASHNGAMAGPILLALVAALASAALFPLIARRQMRLAIDTLLHNMTMVGGNETKAASVR